MNVEKLVIHHSASAKSTTTVEDIEKWHRDKGFNGIGYHKVIETNGVLKLGRPEERMGAHAKGANKNSLGICVTGNFENEEPDEEQIETLVETLSDWCKSHNVDENSIYGHFEVPGCVTTTACPGNNLKSKLDDIRIQVKGVLAND